MTAGIQIVCIMKTNGDHKVVILNFQILNNSLFTVEELCADLFRKNSGTGKIRTSNRHSHLLKKEVHLKRML